ncbi:chymotrypsin inhibitor-like [Odontomachus brunneus]|uniref:chymotrypsin inhibitor-like n=1 Tax=Odontomachus brunneus TaxID=486640 RepID=UPI0013F1A19F|nr:chymotrypsin inhibitor-like [Odontomachus brunneus]
MARLVALLVLVVTVYAVSEAYILERHQCGLHEEWVSCGRPEACEATCDHPPAEFCPDVCVSRCRCQSGYLKNNLNLCVLSTKC